MWNKTYVPYRRKRKKKNKQEEFVDQCHLARWMELQYPDVLWTATLGGVRVSIGLAKKLKRMGYSSGCPDLLFFQPKGRWAGLIIELKKKEGGMVSPNQTRWLSSLSNNGFFATVCNGFDNAKQTIEDYMNGKV